MELEEIRQLISETAQLQKENAREISRVSRQIGEIGNKFGSFTEGMAFPSMERMLRRRFDMTHVTTNFEIELGGNTLEMDVFAYANGEVNTAIIVEVKSHLREREVEQVLKMIEKFPQFFPEHRSKKLYAILAAVQVPSDVRRYALNQGLMVARIVDELFDLNTPASFQPKDFQAGL